MMIDGEGLLSWPAPDWRGSRAFQRTEEGNRVFTMFAKEEPHR